jgi:hypothetical protein
VTCRCGSAGRDQSEDTTTTEIAWREFWLQAVAAAQALRTAADEFERRDWLAGATALRRMADEQETEK